MKPVPPEKELSRSLLLWSVWAMIVFDAGHPESYRAFVFSSELYSVPPSATRLNLPIAAERRFTRASYAMQWILSELEQDGKEFLPRLKISVEDTELGP